MKNYEYKFVEVPVAPDKKEDAKGFSPYKICARVIGTESQAGWRLKQIMEPKMSVIGANAYLVILEREKEQLTFFLVKKESKQRKNFTLRDA